MLYNLGFGALVIAFLTALYGSGAACYGALRGQSAWVESSRRATLAGFLLVTLSAGVLIYLLVSGDYRVQYVYSYTSSSIPFYLKITALWAGQAGSLLFWSWLLSAFGAAVAWRNWERECEFLPWVNLVMLVTLAFFLSLSIFVENPFARFWATASGDQVASMFRPSGGMPLVPEDGVGLNPLLRHPGMVLHPPALYLGFVGFIVPYAYAVAALVTGRSDDRWMRLARRWALLAWLFLSLGLLLGSRWAYDVLGWGGYWGWDPVEIAALLPWLSGTAYLHSAVIQEKRALFKRWNIVLIILTYALVIYGTFLTRSGLFSSVHAFAQSAIGPLFFAFIGITFIVSLTLLLLRWNTLSGEGEVVSLRSREALFMLNNLLFMGILVVCFWGMNFPILSELVTNQKSTVGPPFYKLPVGVLFGTLFLLMGICPLSAWGYSSFKTLGRGIWKPFLISLAVPAAAFFLGVTQPLAYLALWLVALAGSVTLYEYGRAALYRSRRTSEFILKAFWNLAKRNRRRYGGHIIHLGVVLIGLGIIGIEFFQSETQGAVTIDQSLRLAHYETVLKSVGMFDTPDGRNVVRAVMEVKRDGLTLGEITPRRDFYFESNQAVTIPGIYSTLEDDLYVVLVDWEPLSEQGATFKIFHTPLVNWLWIGGLVFILGTLVAALPQREER